MAAIRGSNADTVRGLVKFDEFGNVDRQCLHPQGDARKTGGWSIRSSRPIRTSASSGPMTRPNS